jgi:hypothetical protein
MKRSLAFGIALVLLATSVLPAFAAPRVDEDDPVDVEIQNRTGEVVSFTYKKEGSPDKETVALKNGRTTLDLVPGTYSYKYRACKLTHTGTFTVTVLGGGLIIKKCENGLDSKVTIYNKTKQAFYLTLVGNRKTYRFWIPPGNTTLTLLGGGYRYTATVCSEERTGNLKAKPGQMQTWTWECD